MSFRFPQPSNEDDFELFCLRFCRAIWKDRSFSRYGKRGESQHGIDLIDESGTEPYRAVQCKHHESNKTIPPGEIRDEVTKASSALFGLHEYYILTTARKSTQGQNAVIQINQSQHAKNTFRVYLWSWEDIEEQLSQLDDVTKDKVLHGDSGRSGPAFCQMLTGALEKHFDRPLHSSATHIDLELETIKILLDQHKIEVVEHKLAVIESRLGDRFQAHNHYQFKIFLSQVYSSRCEWQKAGNTILAACQHTPTTDKARINEAVGYELLGHREKAHSIADGLLSVFPQSVRLVSVWVRTAPSTVDSTKLAEMAAPFERDDEELCLAMAYRSLIDERYVDSIRYATLATEIDTSSPHAWFGLAQAKHAFGYRPSRGNCKEVLAEAEEHYSKALKFAKTEKLAGLESAIRVNRGKLRHVLGLSGSDADFTKAIELNGKDETAALEYTKFLLNQNRDQDAISVLTEMLGKPNAARLFYEATARHGRNQGDDRKRAESLWMQVISSELSDHWVGSHIYLVQSAIEAKTQSEARNIITTSRLSVENPFVFHTLCGWLWDSEGHIDKAKAEYSEAIVHHTNDTPQERTFLLAQALAKVGDDEAALPFFEKSYRPGQFNIDCRELLDCAYRLKRHDVVCRICRELRQAGITDHRIVLTEVEILQLYDPEQAIRVAAQHLIKNPTDRYIALWQSVLALRLGRADLLITDVARFPEAGDTTPEATGFVVGLLVETGQQAAALRYAYQALRAHFDEEFVHGQFICQFLRLSDSVPELRIAGIARPGSAVCYREERSEEDRWLIIEDETDPLLDRQEFAPDHPVSQAMNGRRIGEKIILTEGIQPRTATISEAFHKYIYRLRDCMNQFQVRFPGSSAIQMIDVGGPDGDFNLNPLINSLDGQRRHIDQISEMYRTQPIPLVSFARMAGRDEIVTWQHLSSHQSLGIRCCNSPAENLRSAVHLLAQSKSVVLDLLAINTLGQIGLLSLLDKQTPKLIVSQSTFERLVQLAEDAEGDQRSEERISLVGSQLTITPVSLEQRDRYIRYLRSLVDTVRQYTEILPCMKTASLEPKRREQLMTLLGRHNLDSMLLASESDTVLWTDDAILGVLGRTEFQAQRVWTQVVLLHRHESGSLGRGEYCQAVAKLIGRHYHSIYYDAETLIAAADVAEWDTRRWPMPEVMQALHNPAADPNHRIRIAAMAIRAAWQRDLPLMKRQGYVFAVLAGLRSQRIIEGLIRFLPTISPLDVFTNSEVVKLAQHWLRHTTEVLLP
ncbi:MAG: PIN domain-containing protein [Fimbriiglobus sp.]